MTRLDVHDPLLPAVTPSRLVPVVAVHRVVPADVKEKWPHAPIQNMASCISPGCGDDHGAKAQSHVHSPGERDVADTATVRPSTIDLEPVNDLHCADLSPQRNKMGILHKKGKQPVAVLSTYFVGKSRPFKNTPLVLR